MNTQAIELETLKQLELMNKENKTRPSLMLPKYLDGGLVITNGILALKKNLIYMKPISNWNN